MTRVIQSDDFDATLTSILSQEAAMHEAPRFDPFAIADQAKPSRRGPVLGGAVSALVAAAVATGVVLESSGPSAAGPARSSAEVTFTFSVPSGTSPELLKGTASMLQSRMSGYDLHGVTVRTQAGKVLVTGQRQFAASLLARTVRGQLSFRQVAEQRSATPLTATTATPSDPTPSATTKLQPAPDAWTMNLYNTIDCAHPPAGFGVTSPTNFAVGCDKDSKVAYLLYPTYSARNDPTSITVRPSSGQDTGPWKVDMTLHDPAPLEALTNQVAAVHGSWAIDLDGVVYSALTTPYSAPTTSPPVTNGNIRITSTATQESAEDLTAVLGQGPLPVTLQLDY